jgi:hypothetical protein
MKVKKRICEKCQFPASFLRATRLLNGYVLHACEECALDIECEKAHETGTYCPKHGAPVPAEQKGVA